MLTAGLLLERVVGMKARGVMAKPQSGLTTGPPAMGSPTCAHEDLQNRPGVDLLGSHDK